MSEKTNTVEYEQLSDWLTTSQAASIMGVTARRVVQLIDDGELRAKKINPRLWMVKRESVEAYVADK